MIHSTRYATLDHWRGFAALWVVFFHACGLWNPPQTAPLKWLHTLGNYGWFGVHIFFVISGYCLAELAARHAREKRCIGAFLLDRALRIFPVYWTALTVAMILAIIATPFNGRPLLATTETPGGALATPFDLLTNYTVTTPYFGKDPYLGVSWTLTCELAFYAVVALGLLVVRLRSKPFVPLLAGYVLACVQAAGLVDLPSKALDLWPEFMCGMLAWQSVRWKHIQSVSMTASIMGIVILAVLGCTQASSLASLPMSAVFALTLILFHTYDVPLSTASAIIALRWCGLLSYSLYLTHVPFIGPLQNLIHRFNPEAENHAWIPLFLTGSSLIPAWLFYHWIEKPVECWRRKRGLSPVNVLPAAAQ